MSVKINIYNQKCELAGEMDLSDFIFDIDLNNDLVHQAVLAQMGNERQVLAHTKDRSEVSGGGKKPWRQKGTGRARAGSSRSPIWIGGGVTFGPRSDRNFKKDINKKMKRKAIFMVLSDKIRNKSIAILDTVSLDEFKTKTIDGILKNIETRILKTERRNVLLVDNDKNEKLKFSVRNLEGVKNINLENINILDLLKHKNLIITKNAVEKIEETYKS